MKKFAIVLMGIASVFAACENNTNKKPSDVRNTSTYDEETDRSDDAMYNANRNVKDASKSVQDASKSVQDASRQVQDASRAVRDANSNR